MNATLARADGSIPEPRQIMLPAGRPEQIIVGTNFGLLFSEDRGQSWRFSCEQTLSAYASAYLLGAGSPQRIFAMTSGAGLVYSDDDSCSWTAARGSLSKVLPYALAIDPSNADRVYAIGVLREDWHAGESIYVSDDGGLTFGKPVFTAPVQSALLTVMVAPSQPSTLFAAMFSTPQNHPILLRSRDSGQQWEVVADLVDSLGENPFELLAIDANDADTLYARILGPSAETLAKSRDGGRSFVQSVSIPGKLRAFLQLASGTILVAGTAGTDAVGFRSSDGAQSFEPWPEAPRVHALAERDGKLYVAAENFLDGYALAQSDDEGVHLEPLTGFRQVQGIKSCVAGACAKSCAYYAGIDLWPEAVCGAPATPAEVGAPADKCTGPDGSAGARGIDEGQNAPGESSANGKPDENQPNGANTNQPASLRSSGGGCACHLVGTRPTDHWPPLMLLALLSAVGRSVRATDSRKRTRRRGRR